MLAFLTRDTAHNVYLLGQIARGALARDDVAGPLLGYFRDGELEGVCCCGSNLVISHPSSDEALESFAYFARRGRYLVRVAVGSDRGMDVLMGCYGRRTRKIALERAGQLLFELRPGDLVTELGCDALRPAEIEEVVYVMHADQAMVTEELGFNPFQGEITTYRDGWLRRIRERRAWVVGELGRPLHFKLEQSAVSDQAVQLSGVYTAPEHRGRGIARRAVAEMSRRLLQEVPVVTLYVARDNTSAIRVYEKVGFRQVGQIRSVWFDG